MITQLRSEVNDVLTEEWIEISNMLETLKRDDKKRQEEEWWMEISNLHYPLKIWVYQLCRKYIALLNSAEKQPLTEEDLTTTR